ncbi:hypothetical protein PG985_006918 [Apiospora marii]|uniref:Uncharacterized protein n=1 Tax=Apiospora marii TaxID=335849 RepID=A0ABR1SFY7_9PEZI
MEPTNVDITSSVLRRAAPASSNASLQSIGSSFTPPALDHETASTPPTRPCSWIHENSYMYGALRSSSHGSRDESMAPTSLPTSESPTVDMENPWAPPFGGALLTQDEVHRRWALFSDNQRHQFQTMAKRYAEIRKDVHSEAEEILSTRGEKMHVRKVPEHKLFQNWSWESAASRRRKASSTGEETSSSEDDEDTYDEDEDDDEDDDEDNDEGDEEAYEIIDSITFSGKRDSIEVHRQSFGRRSSTEEYYRWSEDENSRGSLVEGIRRMTEKLISAVQSRRASPQGSESNSPDNSDSDEADDEEPSASESPKTKSKLMTLVQRSFSRSQKGRSQNQQKRKHEPCHRSRYPNAPSSRTPTRLAPSLLPGVIASDPRTSA